MKHNTRQAKKTAQFTNRCSKECQNHRLLLSNQHDTQLNCQVAFCPKRHRSTGQNQGTFPVFSNDRRFYTSAFTLQIDRKALQSNQHIELQEYQRKILQLITEPNLVFPKPSKSNKYCIVCKREYQDYFQHITSQQHGQELERNQFTKQIESLTQKFKALHPLDSPQTPIQMLPHEKQNHVGTQQNENTSHRSSNNQSMAGDQNEQAENQEDMERAMFSDSEESKGPEKENNLTQQAQQARQAQQTQNNGEGSEDSSGSVEIVGIKPAKTPRNVKKEEQATSGKKKIKKSKKKKKRNKSNKKQKKNSGKSKKRNGQKKKKKHSKQKRKRERQQSRERSQVRKKALKRRPMDPPPASPPLIHKKMALRVGIKAVHPPQSTTEVVLIEKSQIQNAQIDKSYLKILQNIVATINKGPPAEAPRQYRKIINPMDSRITSSTRITPHFGSVINCQSMNGSRQGLSSQQSQNNSQRMSFTSERTPHTLTSKIANQVIIQDNQSNFIINQAKAGISANINFDKIAEKPDWQKLKQNVISSLEKERLLIEKQKKMVISIQDQEEKEVVASQRKDLNTTKYTTLSRYAPQAKINSFNNIKQNQKKFAGVFPYLLACKTLPKNLQNKQSHYFPLFRGHSYLEKKNDIPKNQNTQRQLSLVERHNSNQSKMLPLLNSTSVDPRVGKIFSQIGYKNAHLTRKFNDNNLKEQTSGGIIDLQLQEIQQIQGNFCRRQDAASKKTNLCIPEANTSLFPKFAALQDIQNSSGRHNEAGKSIPSGNKD